MPMALKYHERPWSPTESPWPWSWSWDQRQQWWWSARLEMMIVIVSDVASDTVTLFSLLLIRPLRCGVWSLLWGTLAATGNYRVRSVWMDGCGIRNSGLRCVDGCDVGWSSNTMMHILHWLMFSLRAYLVGIVCRMRWWERWNLHFYMVNLTQASRLSISCDRRMCHRIPLLLLIHPDVPSVVRITPKHDQVWDFVDIRMIDIYFDCNAMWWSSMTNNAYAGNAAELSSENAV